MRVTLWMGNVKVGAHLCLAQMMNPIKLVIRRRLAKERGEANNAEKGRRIFQRIQGWGKSRLRQE